MTGRTRIPSGGPWKDRVGYSRAVRTGDRFYVFGTSATQPDGTTPECVEAQTRATREATLTAAGATIEDVARVRNEVIHIEEWEQITIARRECFANVRPAIAVVEVSRLLATRATHGNRSRSHHRLR
jgi:enamine deaminase RidA (YjgF/YER057c/UK114 family)